MLNPQFWSGKKVFLTGHTGFKGGWLAMWLRALGAHVAGYGLPPDTRPSFFDCCVIGSQVDSNIGDVRDLPSLSRTIASHEPEIMFHLAAQPLVRRSYRDPVDTLAINVLGTAHLLESARQTPSVRAIIVVTSDKCYHNRGYPWRYREDEPVGGRDPYSASKACAELVSAAYQHSYFRGLGVTVATARAGNVIGGGDWAEDRILPDAIRALTAGKSFGVRNPSAVRPWQHVLEPLAGYLALAEKAAAGGRFAGAWNFGPEEDGAVPVSRLADLIVQCWSEGASWENLAENAAPHEEAYLNLDATKARRMLSWQPRLTLKEAVDWTVRWYKSAYNNKLDNRMIDLTMEQISCYQAKMTMP